METEPKITKTFALLGSFFLTILLIYVDYLSGLEVHLTALMLLPVTFATWYGGLGQGLFISILSSLSLLMDPILERKIYPHLWEVFWNIIVLFIFFGIVAYLLTRLKQELLRAVHTARTDNLTGLLNARAFFQDAEEKRALAIQEGHPLTLCFLDLDHFKQVNDSLGHMTGDELLRIVAKTLTENVRYGDMVVRLGGDEFLVLFPETGPEAVGSLVHKIHREVRAAIKKRGWSVTPSVGAVTFLEIPGTVENMVQKADQMMYHAKANGKDRVELGVHGPATKMAEPNDASEKT